MLVPPIYVDLDDVLAETLRTFSKVLKRLYGRDVPFEAIHSFDLGTSFGLTPSQLQHFMHIAHGRDVLLDEIEPVPEALATLRVWRDAGAHITVVTGRPISTYEATREWLRRHDVPFHMLRFVRKYGRNDLGTSIERPLELRTLYKASFAFVVEDSPKMATFLIKRMAMPVVFLSKPWNAHALEVEADPLLIRCASWTEARAAGIQLLAQGSPVDRLAA